MSATPPRSRSPKPKPSSALTEQQRGVVDAVLAGHDVRIIAHAGTGKTRTVKDAIRARLSAFPTSTALFLAYNRAVKEEVRADFDNEARVKVHTYDSALTEFYDETAPTSNFQLALQRLLGAEASEPVPVRAAAESGEGLRFDLLVVDEAQDLDESFLLLVQKLLRDNSRGAAILVAVGDPKQSINGYRGASSRFFLSEDALFEGRQPQTHFLFAVFRFQYKLCDFVNKVCFPFFESQKDTHWRGDHDYFGDEEKKDPEVVRYVLQPGDERPDALIRRIAELRPVVLTGSRKESNKDLWQVLEQLQGWEPDGKQHLVTEASEHRDAPEVTAYVSNAHPSKGQEYKNVVVFFTNAGTWFARDGSVNAEILYVALTRCKEQLILVESCHTLLLQRMVSVVGGDAARPLPPARSATTGLILDVWPDKVARGPEKHFAPKPSSLSEFVERDMETTTLEALCALLPAEERQVWRAEEGPDRVEAVALWARHDFFHSHDGVFAGLLASVGVDVEEAYAQLWAGRRPRLLTRRLRGILELLGGSPVAGWGWEAWLELARFHPDFHYGHSYVPLRQGREAYLEMMSTKLRRHVAACGRRPSAECYRLGKREYGDCGVYFSRDEVSVRVLVLEGTPADRPVDHVVAACAAMSLEKEEYALHYLAQDRVVPGRLPTEHREAFRKLFWEELERRKAR